MEGREGQQVVPDGDFCIGTRPVGFFPVACLKQNSKVPSFGPLSIEKSYLLLLSPCPLK